MVWSGHRDLDVSIRYYIFEEESDNFAKFLIHEQYFNSETSKI